METIGTLMLAIPMGLITLVSILALLGLLIDSIVRAWKCNKWDVIIPTCISLWCVLAWTLISIGRGS